ncbi:SPRY domain-containing protein [Phytophthora infestans]|uniref:SPRY domain-containing protein n=1 Tax=Phytophthora infestans TaxID=4787 RepID=A0A8S9U2K5_PHYIN|nr:SPRY domain-containing protein [Phytophthora infestans]KAF4148971.1 SPRY domain-containing protein [Phytophthora infestans]
MVQPRASLAPPISSFLPNDIFYDSASDDSDSDVEELFDAGDLVTVEEDLLLVKLRCFHPKLDVSGLSSAFQREFNIQRDPQELEARLEKLQTPEFRALFILYLKSLTISKESSNSGCGILPEYQSLLESTRSLCETQLFQMMYDLDKYQHKASEKLVVEVSGRNFPKYTRTVSKTELRRCCKAVDDLFRRQVEGETTAPNQAFTLYAAQTLNEKLLITDTVPRYDSCAVFNHFEQTIFDRLVLFAKDPTVVERLALQRQQQVEANRIKQQLSLQLRAIFETLRVKQAEKLELMQVHEFETIKTQLEKNLEADLQHIRQMHAALLSHERAKIHARYEEQKSVLNEKVKCMQRDVMALQKKCDSSSWHGLERMIMNTSLQVERIFGSSEYLLRLLILAEDIEADSLRRALVKYISEQDKLPQFVLRRELTSKMVAETTVLAILKESTTKDLLEVASYGASFLHHDLVSRELHTRKIEFGRFLAGLTNDRLRAARRYTLAKRLTSSRATTLHGDVTEDLMSEDAVILDEEFDRFASALEDFPEILSQEFTRRREFSSVKMDSTDIEQYVSFAAEDCVLQLEASHRYCTVHATKEKRQGESGKWMFEVTIDVFGGDGESLLLGWEVPRSHNSNKPLSSPESNDHLEVDSSSMVPGISPSDDGRSFGVTWQSDGGLDMGMLHANGVSKSGVPSFRAGDVIGCTIDQDVAVPQLRFYLNGDLTLPLRRTPNNGGAVGSLASDTSGIPSSFGIAVTNPAYRLAPVVSMYSSSKKPQMRVTFNFRGDFKFPIVGFDPFGALL